MNESFVSFGYLFIDPSGMKKNNALCFELKSTLFFLFLFLIPSLRSQTTPLDSLLNAVSTMDDDTNKVNTLHAISRIYYSEWKDIDKLKEYNQRELILSQKLNYKKGIAYAYLNNGIVFRSISDLKMADYYDKTALRIMREIKDKKGEGSSLINIAFTKSLSGNTAEAISYLNEAIKLLESIHAKRQLLIAYNNLATTLQTKGNYEDAMRYNLKSLKLSEELKDKTAMAMSYNNIGVLLYSQKKLDQALGYYLKAIQQLGNNERSDMANAFNNMGNVYIDKNMYQKALYFYLKTLKIREKTNDKRGAAMTYNNIGNVYLEQNQTKPALNYHLKAYHLSRQIGDKKSMVTACNSLGNTYEKLKEFDSARYYYTEALTVGKEVDFKQGVLDAYENFSSLYKEEKRFDKALEYSLLFKAMSDSSLNEASLKQINELTTRYETEKKEQEILLLTKDQELNAKIIKEQKQERLALILGVCLLSISVISIYRRYRFKQRANEILQKQKQEIELTLHELTLAQDELYKVVEQKEKLTSILAHDLRTPLRFMSTISNYLHKNVSTITTAEMEELSAELSTSSKSTFAFADELLTWLGIQKNNYKVERTVVDILTLLNELSVFFFDIAKMKGTQIKVQLKEDVKLETDERLLKIILRNIIDNAIKYTTDGTILLHVTKNKEQIEIQVQDTGEGMTQEQLEKLMDKNMFGFPFQIKDKLGFQIVRDLAALIECSIQIESEIGKGTTVILTFILKTTDQ